MALYRYNARDRENRKYKGVKEAGSEAELVKALLEDGDRKSTRLNSSHAT